MYDGLVISMKACDVQLRLLSTITDLEAALTTRTRLVVDDSCYLYYSCTYNSVIDSDCINSSL